MAQVPVHKETFSFGSDRAAERLAMERAEYERMRAPFQRTSAIRRVRLLSVFIGSHICSLGERLKIGAISRGPVG